MVHKALVKVPDEPKPGFTVGVLWNKQLKSKGDVGIEIEVEGSHLPKFDDVPAPWAYKEDHSLRGTDNAEYVLSKPIEFSKVSKTLAALWAAFDKFKSKIDDSNRTSVHVHLNVQDFHLNRLASFVALYIVFEDVITELCGEHRKGNLFCLRATDAPAITTVFKKFFQKDGRYEVNSNWHYAGLNPQAIMKFGSLEVRTMRGVSDPKQIEDWISILKRLYDASETFPDPRSICASFSMNGPQAMFEEILGADAQLVRTNTKLSGSQISDMMYDGIRLAQDICYCRDWSAYKPVDLKPDPFGRPSSQVAKSLSQGASPIPQHDTLISAGGYAGINIQVADDEEDYPPDDDDVEPYF